MNRLTVIGAGPRDKKMMTLEAVSAVEAADAVWCAARNEDMVPGAKRRPLTPFGNAMDEMEKALSQGLKAAVLLSGDTGLFSLLPIIEKRFGEKNIRVLCGVSSVQALCARLAISWQDARIISAHGRALAKNALCHWARTTSKTLVLLDGERDPKWVHETLEEGGLGKLRLLIGEKLSYPDESVGPYEERPYDELSVALIINDQPENGMTGIGLKDELFIRGKTPMTKSEIRAQVITQLQLAPDSIVWDIGAGTGSVSVESALNCPLGEVYAIERDEEALKLIAQNKGVFHTINLHVIAGSAPQALAGLPVPTHVFLGGTGGETPEILNALETMNRAIRICATAVTMESAALFMERFSGYSCFSAAQIAVSRLEKVGRYNLFRAQNPVFVFSANMEAKE